MPHLAIFFCICPYAHIWPYGHMGIWAYAKKYGQMGYPRKENQKSSSEMLSRGPQDTPIKSYGQKSILGNFTMYIPLSTSDGWHRGIYGSINLKKIMKPSFDQPKNISDDWTQNPIFFCIRLLGTHYPSRVARRMMSSRVERSPARSRNPQLLHFKHFSLLKIFFLLNPNVAYFSICDRIEGIFFGKFCNKEWDCRG